MALEDYFGEELKTGLGPCRHRPTLIFKVGNLEVHGASEMYVQASSVRGFDLVVSLLGRRRFSEAGNLIRGPRKWAFLRRFTSRAIVEELVLDWKDQDSFPVGRDFWVAFYEALRDGGYKKILFYCMGGHGRTGTAVGCLMTVALNIHGGRAVKEIRDNYCKSAIETRKQEDYVRSMTKIVQ